MARERKTRARTQLNYNTSRQDCYSRGWAWMFRILFLVVSFLLFLPKASLFVFCPHWLRTSFLLSYLLNTVHIPNPIPSACQDISCWPQPIPGTSTTLSLLGNSIEVHIYIYIHIHTQTLSLSLFLSLSLPFSLIINGFTHEHTHTCTRTHTYRTCICIYSYILIRTHTDGTALCA